MTMDAEAALVAKNDDLFSETQTLTFDDWGLGEYIDDVAFPKATFLSGG